MELNESNFGEEVFNSSQPVLVDFYGQWCPPCRMLSPIIDKLASMEGVKVAKVDIEENQNIVEYFKITSIPTIMIFNNGEVIHRFSGVKSESFLRECLENLL